MLKGRLGLETARVPHSDRHGLMWLGRGNLFVAEGCLRFATSGFADLERGEYSIPLQALSCILLMPGSTVSHDALRILARNGCGLVCIGEGGVRMYASMPFGPDASARARLQARAWADEGLRVQVARRMYAWRLGEVFPTADIAVLRGMEGARMKATYKRLAEQYGVAWDGRCYDRQHPEDNDEVNQAINHAASAVEAGAMIAVAATGAIPQLGFVHEDSGNAFTLDIADLFRDSVTLPAAFGAVSNRDPSEPLERTIRRVVGKKLRDEGMVGRMIERIKELLRVDDGRSNP